MRDRQAVRRDRLGLPLTLLACCGLYFLTPVLPAWGDGILFGATAVLGMAFVFLVWALSLLQHRPPCNALLVGAALLAGVGVVGMHTSLYQFAPPPRLTEHTVFLEQADRVLLVEQHPESMQEDRIVALSPKRFWLLKTFTINGFLLVAATALGVWLGRQVEKASHLWAIVVLSTVMDLWSVTAGVTAKIVASPSTSYFFLLNWPLAGQGGVTYPLIGATDFLFVALFLFLARKFHLAFSRNVMGLATAMIVAVLSAVILQRGVPALPCLGGAVLLVNFRSILPERYEALQIALGAVVSLGVFAVLWHNL